jgi:hypothetical protein
MIASLRSEPGACVGERCLAQSVARRRCCARKLPAAPLERMRRGFRAWRRAGVWSGFGAVTPAIRGWSLSRGGVITLDRARLRFDHERLVELARRWGCGR